MKFRFKFKGTLRAASLFYCAWVLLKNQGEIQFADQHANHILNRAGPPAGSNPTAG